MLSQYNFPQSQSLLKVFLKKSFCSWKSSVTIPNRIERGPLDILKVLSATITENPNPVQYILPDHFTSYSSYKKRSSGLSFDSGRRAARWVVQQNPTLFQHKVADPYIKAFAPKPNVDADSEVTEEILLDLINDSEVSSAIKVYKLLKEKCIDVSQSTKQALLELVCFYNSMDKPEVTLLESKYFQNTEQPLLKTWKNGDFAEQLFQDMEKNSQSYSALIQGLFKFHDIKNALNLYDQTKEKEIKLTVGVYNELLAHVASMITSFSGRIDIIKELLQKMKTENIKPNLGTFISLLKSISEMKSWPHSKEYALKVVNEFDYIGIKPSLGCYYHLLNLFFDHIKVNSIFLEILTEVEEKSWTLLHPDDIKFFLKAMEICCVNYKSFSLAERVHKTLCFENNMDFLCNSFIEGQYYRYYFLALFKNEDIHTIMNKYLELVPIVYTPEVTVFHELLKTVKKENAIAYLPKLWQHINELNLSFSDKIIEEVLRIIATCSGTKVTDFNLSVAQEIWNLKEDTSLRRKVKRSWTSQSMSDLLIIYMLGNDLKMAINVFRKAESLNIELNSNVHEHFFDFCITNKCKQEALDCIKYFASCEHPQINKMIEKVKLNFELDSDSEHVINSVKLDHSK